MTIPALATVIQEAEAQGWRCSVNGTELRFSTPGDHHHVVTWAQIDVDPDALRRAAAWLARMESGKSMSQRYAGRYDDELYAAGLGPHSPGEPKPIR